MLIRCFACLIAVALGAGAALSIAGVLPLDPTALAAAETLAATQTQ